MGAATEQQGWRQQEGSAALAKWRRPAGGRGMLVLGTKDMAVTIRTWQRQNVIQSCSRLRPLLCSRPASRRDSVQPTLVPFSRPSWASGQRRPRCHMT